MVLIVVDSSLNPEVWLHPSSSWNKSFSTCHSVSAYCGFYVGSPKLGGSHGADFNHGSVNTKTAGFDHHRNHPLSRSLLTAMEKPLPLSTKKVIVLVLNIVCTILYRFLLFLKQVWQFKDQCTLFMLPISPQNAPSSTKGRGKQSKRSTVFIINTFHPLLFLVIQVLLLLACGKLCFLAFPSSSDNCVSIWITLMTICWILLFLKCSFSCCLILFAILKMLHSNNSIYCRSNKTTKKLNVFAILR